MKMNMKKLLAMVLTLCVCASLMAPMASAVYGDELVNKASGTLDTSNRATITLSNIAYESTGGTYDLRYSASLNMTPQLANALAMLISTPTNKSKLDNLRFICTLSDDIIANQIGNYTGPTDFDEGTFYSFSSSGGLYVFDSGKKTDDNKLELTYKLSSTILTKWKDAGTSPTEISSDLQKSVTFASNAMNVPAALVNTSVHTEATLLLRMNAGGLQDYEAAYGDTYLTIYVPSSGGGGSSSSGITLTETDTSTGKSSTTNGLNSATTDTSGNKDDNDYPASGGAVSVVSVTSQNGKPKTGNPSAGDTVVINVDPNPGKKIDSVTVTMANGQKVTVEYKNDGNYQFVMPSGAIKVDVNYESCPYVPSDSGVDELLITDRHVLYTIGDDEGNWRPDANVKRDEVAIMFMRLLRNQNVAITTSYDDVDSDAWYYEAVNKISSLGIMEGDGDGNFRPEEPMTRAEFAKSCVGFATKDPIAPGADFSDVSRLAWYYSYIQKAVAYGWIEGYNGEFRPDDYITRAEAVTIINRMLARPADHDAIDNGAGTSFPDVPDNFWGRDAIEESTTAHNETVDEPTYVEEWHENGTETVNG